jgi:hypothetical protein
LLEHLCRRALLSTNRLLPRALSSGGCADLWVVRKTGLQALVDPAETECHGFRFVAVPKMNDQDKSQKAGNGNDGQRKQKTANHGATVRPLGIEGTAIR